MEKMTGTITEITSCYILINEEMHGEVRINTKCGCRFNVGDTIEVTHNGAMTMSIPPQISAIKICKVCE